MGIRTAHDHHMERRRASWCWSEVIHVVRATGEGPVVFTTTFRSHLTVLIHMVTAFGEEINMSSYSSFGSKQSGVLSSSVLASGLPNRASICILFSNAKRAG